MLRIPSTLYVKGEVFAYVGLSQNLKDLDAIGAIGALRNRVHQPRTLLVLGHNAGMGTAAGADELVEVPYR